MLRYLHADLDSFFVSVEVLKNPQLKGLPVIVGGTGKRGVVSTCSYEARAFGIHSAMPMYLALHKCPKAIVLPHDMQSYKTYSDTVFDILDTFTPTIEKMSVDEAYLDMEGCEKLHGSTLEVLKKIRHKVLTETGLTISIGASFNKTLAKIATGMAKPDGYFVIHEELFETLKYTLPLNVIPGIGKKTEERLKRLGLETGGDLLSQPVANWIKYFGSYTQFMINFFKGIDDKHVRTDSVRKSVAKEHTFPEDTGSEEALQKLSEFCREFSTYLLKHDLKPRQVTLKIRTPQFKTVTRSKTFKEEVWMERDIFEIARGLWQSLPTTIKTFRLVGLSLSHFGEEAPPQDEAQLILLPDEHSVIPQNDKRNKAAKVMESLKIKMGQNAIQWGMYSTDKKDSDKHTLKEKKSFHLKPSE